MNPSILIPMLLKGFGITINPEVIKTIEGINPDEYIAKFETLLAFIKEMRDSQIRTEQKLTDFISTANPASIGDTKND